MKFMKIVKIHVVFYSNFSLYLINFTPATLVVGTYRDNYLRKSPYSLQTQCLNKFNDPQNSQHESTVKHNDIETNK